MHTVSCAGDLHRPVGKQFDACFIGFDGELVEKGLGFLFGTLDRGDVEAVGGTCSFQRIPNGGHIDLGIDTATDRHGGYIAVSGGEAA